MPLFWASRQRRFNVKDASPIAYLTFSFFQLRQAKVNAICEMHYMIAAFTTVCSFLSNNDGTIYWYLLCMPNWDS